MTILLKGEIYVRREHGGPAALFIGRSGLITGLLPFSRMKAYGGLGYTSAPTWVLEFDRSLFPEMLKAIPSLTERLVGILLDRVREITRMEQQSEKLNALGKLAGNLAHELNNPASAAQRSAAGVLEELRVYGHERFNLGRLVSERREDRKGSGLGRPGSRRGQAAGHSQPKPSRPVAKTRLSAGFTGMTYKSHGTSLPSWPSLA